MMIVLGSLISRSFVLLNLPRDRDAIFDSQKSSHFQLIVLLLPSRLVQMVPLVLVLHFHVLSSVTQSSKSNAANKDSLE